jgi:hypothetical protein
MLPSRVTLPQLTRSARHLRGGGDVLICALMSVEAAHSFIDSRQDRYAVLGEQVAVDVLGCLNLAVPISLATCMSVAPEAIISDAQTWRNSCAV